VERYAVIWIWMGDAKLAKPAEIPEFSYLSDREMFAACQGYSHIKGNYQLISDNLLDLSHVHYLHPTIHEGSDFAKFTNKVQREGDRVWSMLWRHHYHLGDAKRKFYGLNGEDVEGQGHSRWDAPGVLLVETAFWDHGKSIMEGVELPSSHLITPETEYTSHYFWGSGRTVDIHNEAITTGTAATMKAVFETQDGPMVDAQQKKMGATTEFLEQKPIILQADAAGVMARRIMSRKIRDEAGGVMAGSPVAAG
jgi:vanillate O-demethylase monooxygenase subunit